MKKFLKLSVAAVVVLLAAASLNSCKKKYDEPPVQTDPALTANTTIKALKALHTTSAAYDLITTDIIISGTVVADDKSGNLYKQLFIQDATGGIQVLLDATSLYNTYPVGRKVFIKCNGLCLSDYNGMIELGVKANINGSPSVEGIPGSLVADYLVGGSINNPVVPVTVTLAQLGTSMQDQYLGSLIKLEDFEFSSGDFGRTYSDTSAYKTTTNLNIKTCSGASTIIRTSAYANFAGIPIAKGNGSVTAIYTVFGTTKQLLIRDTNDVKMTGPRCFIFEEDFGSLTVNGLTFAFPTWKNIGEVGGVPYQTAVFGSTGKCVKIQAFGSNQNVVTSWLITPPIALPAGSSPKLSFTTSDAFDNGATLKAYVSTNYTGSATPSTATWTLLPATISSGHTTSTFGPFLSSGTLSLSAYAGQTVYIGFRYDGADPTGTASDKTTTIEVDDVTIAR